MHKFFQRSVLIRLGVAVFLTFAYLLYMYYLDDYSLVKRNEHKAKIIELKQQISAYEAEYKANDSLIKALEISKETVERYAREHYHMKKENEQVFLIKDKN
jgi:cell division protein FtsB